MLFIIGFFFISLFGTFLHFAYDITKHSKIFAIFSAVNESIWEHIKIALTPFFVWCIVDGYFYGINPNYFLAKVVGCLTLIIVMPVIFYSYNLFTKKPILFIDISSFFIAIGLGQYFSYLILNMNSIPYFLTYISVIVFFLIFGFYMVATLMPLKSSIFLDPITKKYGLKGHK